MKQRLRARSSVQVTIMAVVIAVLILFVSPLALLLLNKLLVLNWDLLSNIGQSYTGVYTLFSAGALVAVAVTVQAQTKQTVLAQQQATKDLQLQLLSLGLSYPDMYGSIFGYCGDDQNHSTQYRQDIYVNMWMRYASFAYETDEIGEVILCNDILPKVFATEEGRRWYRMTFSSWVLLAADHRHPRLQKFVSIMEEEYNNAVA